MSMSRAATDSYRTASPTDEPTSPAADALDLEMVARLRLAIVRVARRIRAAHLGGITPSQLSALVTIETLGPLTPSELAQREYVAAPTMTRVLTALRVAGLVESVPNPDDGRSVKIATTPAASRLLAEGRREHIALLAERMARLDETQLARLTAALPVLETLASDDGPTPGG
jgi:DNA-binding MarR family transcriptional regulator